MTINDRVKELRKAQNLTLDKFGERVGVTKTAISNIEKGYRNVTEQMFKLICSEFNVRKEWLRDGIGPVYDISDANDMVYIEMLMNGVDSPFRDFVLDIIKSYCKLDKDSQIAVMQFINSIQRNKQDRN